MNNYSFYKKSKSRKYKVIFHPRDFVPLFNNRKNCRENILW